MFKKNCKLIHKEAAYFYLPGGQFVTMETFLVGLFDKWYHRKAITLISYSYPPVILSQLVVWLGENHLKSLWTLNGTQKLMIIAQKFYLRPIVFKGLKIHKKLMFWKYVTEHILLKMRSARQFFFIDGKLQFAATFKIARLFMSRTVILAFCVCINYRAKVPNFFCC